MAFTPGTFACGCCGELIRSVHAGRGRSFGQHPDHRYAQCGHSIDWFTPVPTPTPIATGFAALSEPIDTRAAAVA